MAPTSTSTSTAKQYAPRGRALPHLRAWRMARLLTQQKLGKAAHPAIHHTTISRIEGGGVASWSAIERLAAALDITPQQLISEAPDEG